MTAFSDKQFKTKVTCDNQSKYTLGPKRKTLAEALMFPDMGGHETRFTIWSKPKEDKWAKVQRMRAEDRPFMKGGRHKEQPIFSSKVKVVNGAGVARHYK